MESGPQLISLTPFEEGEEEVIRPTSMGAARVLSQMISIEGDVPKPQKIIVGKEPRSAGPKSTGPKPAGSKTVASKEPRSAGPKSAGPKSAGPKSAGLMSAGPKSAGPRSAGSMSAGPMPTGPKTAGGRPPRPTVGGKAPRKQVVPQKKKSRPGSGSLNYVPSNRDFLEAEVVGDTLPTTNKTTKRYRPGCLALQEIRHYQNVPTF